VSCSVCYCPSCLLTDRCIYSYRAVYAAISSVSLSLIATGIDSVFDFGSNLFLYYIHKQALKMDLNKWPVGGSRLETIGNIVYGETFFG